VDDKKTKEPIMFVKPLLIGLFGCLILVHGWGNEDQQKKEAKDLKAMEGVWEAKVLYREGKEVKLPHVDPGAGLNLKVTKGKAVIELGGKALEGTFTIKLDCSSQPYKIDLIEVNSSERMYGVYEFQGDRLKLALLTETTGTSRPLDYLGKTGLAGVFQRPKK
jgi:uncharacterized protein (TIGR03067 family)